MSKKEGDGRVIGLAGATGIGVGAIVGGGILALGGVAFAQTGPSAIVAFALNGLIALLTAASFAEISSVFPESGGTYSFAKKVFSIRIAFVVGWILWSAYIVAGVLYALGFASYMALVMGVLWQDAPSWLHGKHVSFVLAAVAALIYGAGMIRKNSDGAQWATVGKVVLFFVVILAGCVAVVRQPIADTQAALTPFFSNGVTGLVAAMGFTFIALQGFDLIAAVAGEVKRPKTIVPKAIFSSLGIALVIYLPFLFVVSAVGAEPGTTVPEMAQTRPETVIAEAAGTFMGPVGYWLIVAAAILAMLSALRANMMAASRVALAMARDRTLPLVLAAIHKRFGTPAMAVYATTLALIAILLMIPNLAVAGAAASLIFLLIFSITNLAAFLVRRRTQRPLHDESNAASGFRTPFFPALPVLGGLSCVALAVFQGVVVPDATKLVVVWMGLGGMIYVSLFARQAETVDASAQALDPTLVRLRGRIPFVLLPIANPAHASAMVAVANALAPSGFGRVVLLSIMPDGRTNEEPEMAKRMDDVQRVIRDVIMSSYAEGHAPEVLITRAPVPSREIVRVAKEYECDGALLGFGDLEHGHAGRELERMINELPCDVALMRTPPDWALAKVQRILVPVGGRGEQHELRARVLGSITRQLDCEVTFLSILPEGSTDMDIKRARRAATKLCRTEIATRRNTKVRVVCGDVTEEIVRESANYDLTMLGIAWVDNRRVLSPVTKKIATRGIGALMVLAAPRSGLDWRRQVQRVVDLREHIPTRFVTEQRAGQEQQHDRARDKG